MEKFEKIATRLFEKAIEENDNPYSITSKIMWWELFYNLNRDKSLIEALSQESILLDLFDAELSYHCDNKNQIPIEGKLQKIKISFLNMLKQYFKENISFSLEQTNIRINEKNYLDRQLIKEFNAFKEWAEQKPEKMKKLIKDYQIYHNQVVQDIKDEIKEAESSTSSFE